MPDRNKDGSKPKPKPTEDPSDDDDDDNDVGDDDDDIGDDDDDNNGDDDDDDDDNSGSPTDISAGTVGAGNQVVVEAGNQQATILLGFPVVQGKANSVGGTYSIQISGGASDF